MESIKFTCIYCGAVALSVFLTAIIGVMAMRPWEAEDEEDYYLRQVDVTRIAWIASCIVNGGFLAYIISTMR